MDLGDDAVASVILRVALDADTKFSTLKGTRTSDDFMPGSETYRLAVPTPKGIASASLRTDRMSTTITLQRLPVIDFERTSIPDRFAIRWNVWAD